MASFRATAKQPMQASFCTYTSRQMPHHLVDRLLREQACVTISSLVQYTSVHCTAPYHDPHWPSMTMTGAGGREGEAGNKRDGRLSVGECGTIILEFTHLDMKNVACAVFTGNEVRGPR